MMAFNDAWRGCVDDCDASVAGGFNEGDDFLLRDLGGTVEPGVDVVCAPHVDQYEGGLFGGNGECFFDEVEIFFIARCVWVCVDAVVSGGDFECFPGG